MRVNDQHRRNLTIISLRSLIIGSLCLCILPSAQERIVYVSQFEQPNKSLADSNKNELPPPWKIVHLNSRVPETQYQIIVWDNVLSIQAIANASMSLLARPIQIDLQRTPILCWRWRIDAPLINADLRTKEGDDYAARIYIALRLPNDAMNFSTKLKIKIARSIYGEAVPDAALNYVWDNRYPIGTKQSNAFTDRTQMIVMETGRNKSGKWVTERRNVLADATDAFGQHTYTTTLFAVAADTDNTGESARSGFADLHFVDLQTPCQF